MSPLLLAVIVAGAVSAFCWIASLITRDMSWVDRIWSIVPVAYVWIFAAGAGLADPRLDVIAVLVTAWGARLTFNFARKGGYSGVEDYRWPILRAKMPAFAWQLFNLFFIVLFQNAVILAITFPAFTAYEHSVASLQPTPFGLLDVALAVAFIAFLGGETLADQQQWDFHLAKRAGGPDFQPRFLQGGLWRFSRHPNYFFELAQWWVVFGFGAVAAGTVLVWTAGGVAVLTILFIGSTIFTESITRSKYPEYADYQARVSPVVPWPPRRTAAEKSPA
jgi:steroid 5-alpha reductase family enzyme